MNQQNTIDRLQHLVKADLETLRHNIIVKDGKSYLVFDRYEILKNAHGVQVKKYCNEVKVFETSRTALSWCIADKYNQIRLAMRIKTLDDEKQLLDADIMARQHLAKKIQDTHRREVVYSKIYTRQRRLREVSEQLDKCVNLAKYWQIRGFNNETARTGRPASPRTSR